MLFSVLLNVFDLDHDGVPFPRLMSIDLPGGPGPLTTRYIVQRTKKSRHLRDAQVSSFLSNSGVSRKPLLIFWKPRPSNLIAGVRLSGQAYKICLRTAS